MEHTNEIRCNFVSSAGTPTLADTAFSARYKTKLFTYPNRYKTMKRRYLHLIALMVALIGTGLSGIKAQTSTIQPDSVCIGGTENYAVDSVDGSKYVWGIKGGQGTILTPSTDSAAHIQISWDNTLGVDTLWVVEVNEFGCNGDTNKLAVVRFSVPEVTISNTTLDVCEGTTLNLSVVVSGLMPYTFQWYHNGNPLTGEESSTLAIPNADATHAGNYTCQVTNACGVKIGRASCRERV